MKKSLLFLLTLLSATILFWGCEDEKTITNTEYVHVNISDIIDTIGLDIYDFVKKDTILDTAKGDTTYKTNTEVLEYGTVLYSAGSFNCYIQKVSVDRRHIRKALIFRDLTIYDTVSSNDDPDTVINSTDTLFLDSVSSYDSTKLVILGADAFSDTVAGSVNDTIITSNNSYLMTVNGSSAGYVGLGYLMYGGALDVSIAGLKNVDAESIILAHNNNIYIASGDEIIKISSNIVNDTSVTIDTLSLTGSAVTTLEAKDSILIALDSANSQLFKIDISSGNFTISDTISVSGTLSNEFSIIDSSIVIIVNDSLKKVDASGIISSISNSVYGSAQTLETINDSILVVLTPRQGDITRGALEVIKIKGDTATSLGAITSARYVPSMIKNLVLISETEGYVLDESNNTLYKVNFAMSDIGTEIDFLTEISTFISSYTIDNNYIFAASTDGYLGIYSHNDISAPMKVVAISGGAATSLSILN